MEEKKYLSEEKYQKNKKKIARIAFVVFVIGILSGGFLIYKGVTESSSTKNNERLSEIKKEKEALNEQIDAKEYECDSLDMSSATWYQDKNKCNREVQALTTKISELKSEEFNLNGNHSSFKSTSYYIFGGFIILVACMMSGSIYMVTKRREILAFGLQQVMPIAEEGAEKVVPVVGKAMDQMAPYAGKAMDKAAPHIGNVAKEISKAIHEGKKDNKE